MDMLSPDSAMKSSLQGQGFVSLSKQLGQKMISDSLWARNTSMVGRLLQTPRECCNHG